MGMLRSFCGLAPYRSQNSRKSRKRSGVWERKWLKTVEKFGRGEKAPTIPPLSASLRKWPALRKVDFVLTKEPGRFTTRLLPIYLIKQNPLGKAIFQDVSEYIWKSDWENPWALLWETNRESQQYSGTALGRLQVRFEE